MTQEKTEAVAEQVVETPSAPVVEDLASLREKLTKLEVELEQTKKGLSTAHQTLTQKDRDLKNQSDLRAEIQGIREDMELLAVGFATREEGEPTDGTSRQNVLAELQKRRTDADVKRKQETDALARQDYNLRADVIYAQAKGIFGEGQEEKLEDIEDLLKSGNIIRAEQRLARASKSKTIVTEDKTPKETDEERIERLVKEKLAKDFPNMYASDTSMPSGSSRGSPTEAMSLYIKGEITAEEAEKRGVDFK